MVDASRENGTTGEWRFDVLKSLGRVENAVTTLIDRIASVESSLRTEDGKIWSELRGLQKEIQDTCGSKRRMILDLGDKRRGEVEQRVGIEIKKLWDKVAKLEETVVGVEHGIIATETQTRDVVSISDKIGALAGCMTEIKVDMEGMKQRMKAIEDDIREIKDTRKSSIGNVLTILALLMAAAAILVPVIMNLASKGG